jgi:hypothetical protein
MAWKALAGDGVTDLASKAAQGAKGHVACRARHHGA